jgi:hypothetical protein
MSHHTPQPSHNESLTDGDDATPVEEGAQSDQDTAKINTAPEILADGQSIPNRLGDVAAHIPVPGAEGDTDPYNLDSLRITQDFAGLVGVKKLVTTIPVRKPIKECYIRTHPDSNYRLQTAVLELKEDRESYLVAPQLWPALALEPTFSPRLLITSVTRQGVPFVWPIRLPGADGRLDNWNRSAMDAAEEARTQWVRVAANMSLGAYEITVAPNQVAKPAWPELSFQQIVKIAFRERMISDWDHPVLMRLRGEV